MFRSLWFWLIALVLVPALTGVLWFVSDFDLQAQDARMRAAGLPATWEEWKKQPRETPSATVAALRDQIAEVARGRGSRTWRYVIKHEEVRELLAKVSVQELEDLAKVTSNIDPSGDGFGYARTSPYEKDKGAISDLMTEIVWRLRVGAVSDAAEMRHLLCVLMSLSMGTGGPYLPNDFCVGLLCGPEQLNSTSTARWLKSVAKNIRQDVPSSIYGDYINLRYKLGVCPEFRIECSSIEVLEWELNIIPEFKAHREILGWRWNRAAILAEVMNLSVWWQGRSAIDDIAVVNTLDALDHEISGLAPNDIRKKPWRDVYIGITQQSLRSSLYCELMASFIDGSPWPIDPWGDGTTRLNPIRRNGAIVGGYSLGPDRIDNGGDRESDWCFPLAGPLGSPKAADLPEDGVTTWRIPPPDASVPASPDPVPRPPSRRRRVPSPSSE